MSQFDFTPKWATAVKNNDVPYHKVISGLQAYDSSLSGSGIDQNHVKQLQQSLRYYLDPRTRFNKPPIVTVADMEAALDEIGKNLGHTYRDGDPVSTSLNNALAAFKAAMSPALDQQHGITFP